MVSDANSKLATAKTTANDAVASWTADAHKYADQDTTSIADDVAELNQLTSKDNVTATRNKPMTMLVKALDKCDCYY